MVMVETGKGEQELIVEEDQGDSQFLLKFEKF